MKSTQKNTTFKRLIFLIAIFLFGFGSLFTMNKIFTNLVKELDMKTNNLESKISIGEFIAYDLVEIRSLFHELATTTTNKRTRDNVIEKIEDKVFTINESLHTLQTGGTLKRFVALNIAGHRNAIKTIYLDKPESDGYSLETIDIKPKLTEIVNMSKEVNKLLAERSKFKKLKNTKAFMKAAKKVRRYYKALPSYFKRLSENIGRLLYEGEQDLKVIKQQIMKDKIYYAKLKIYLILFIVFIVAALGYIIAIAVNRDSKKLSYLNENLNNTLKEQERQERSIRAILDAQSNIIVVSSGNEMIEANQQLFNFFDKYKDLDKFQADHECLCDFFETNIPNDEYIIKTNYGKLNWSEHIMAHPNTNFKVIMKKDNVKHHFLIKVINTILDDETGESVIIVTLNDITAEINSQIKLASMNENLGLLVANKTKELQELNDNLEQKIVIETQKVREKDKQMTQQARSAAMGEMIGNIAHQWRQPLSAINTTASGMEVQIQLGLASNDDVSKSYHKIMGYVDFLTQTIEDFRGFLKEDKEKINFNIIETLNRTLSVTSASYKDTDITIINDTNDKVLTSFGMPSELSQVFLNILNNARDILVDKDIKNKLVYIGCEQTNDTNIIYIHDNAGGIPDDIIDKIFDPYFTTKHQSQGTGIGLYMSQTIIEKTMSGTIQAMNKNRTVDKHDIYGACFKIEIPKIST